MRLSLQCYHILCLFLRKLEFNVSEKSLHLINTGRLKWTWFESRNMFFFIIVLVMSYEKLCF